MAKVLDFNHLDSRISDYKEPIYLNHDVVLGDLEHNMINTEYSSGIKIGSNDMVIDGNGHTIDAKGKVRIFNVSKDASITLKNINFKNGFTEKHGGAIRNAGKCKLINCTFENNNAKGNGNDISNGNEMTICNCKFSNKDAINNIKSIYLLEDEREEMEHFISGGNIYLVTPVGPPIDDPVEPPLEPPLEPPVLPEDELTQELTKTLFLQSEEEKEALKDFLKNLEKPEGVLVPGEGRLPFPAYEGNEKYIFISYAHKDSEKIFKEIRDFYDRGYHVWYDEGISPGNEWKRDIVTHLVKASLLIVFMTFNSVKSENVKKEIFFAIHKKVPILPIYLDDFDEIHEMMDLELEFELTNIQGIKRTTLSDEEYVYKYTKAFKLNGFEISEKLK